VGAGNALPGIVSTYTTEFPGDTLPSIVPPMAVVAKVAITASVIKQLRIMKFLSWFLRYKTGMDAVQCNRQSG
jgi:hypothetical protein